MSRKDKKTMDQAEKKSVSKSFKTGSYSMFLTIIVLAILVLVNIVVAVLPKKVTQFDVSPTDIYTLTDTTKAYLKTLDTDVRMIMLVQAKNAQGDLVKRVQGVLDRYAAESSHIILETIDPVLYPQFLEDNAITLNEGSVVVMANDRIQQCDISNMFVTESGEKSNNETLTSVDIEGMLTGAIGYVTQEKLPKVYQIVGHDETPIGAKCNVEIGKQAISLETIELTTEDEDGKTVVKEIPEDADALILNCPQKDYSKKEYEVISKYMEEGGSALVVDTVSLIEDNMRNFKKLLREYGVEMGNGAVIETNTAYLRDSDEPYYLYPQLRRHAITNSITDDEKKVVFWMCDSINLMEEEEGLTVTPIIQTSNSAYFKERDSATMSKLVTDKSGIFYVGVTIEKENQDKKSKMVVYSSTSALSEEAAEEVNGGNIELTVNSLMWLCNQDTKFQIQPKPLYMEKLVLSQRDINKATIITVVVIPVIVLLYGIVVWIRRRRR